jgi:hypothetical protein
MVESNPIRIAVVGHTNVGKTSLLRTLTKNRCFGEVADQPGTTRHVEAAKVMLHTQAALEWYDTPGLEDSVGLRDRVDAIQSPGLRLDGPDRIERFLNSARGLPLFEQEQRVLAQVLQSDAMLYVVDARDAVLEKHRDEIHLLQSCARPLLPVFNFTAGRDADVGPWIEVFARHGIHVHLSFDTVSPPINGEQEMYATLAQLMGRFRTTFQALATQADEQRQRRLHAALNLVADLCVTAAAARQTAVNEPQAIELGVQQQRELARGLESGTVSQLLALYEFDPQDYLPPGIDLSDGQWSVDLFSKQAMALAGVELGKGAAMGAIAGAAIDLASVGLTFGTGTLVGAALGSAWQGAGRFGSQLSARIFGRREIWVGDEVVMVMAARNLSLVVALEHRGHAAQGSIHLAQQQGPLFDRDASQALMKAIAAARAHPGWVAQSQQGVVSMSVSRGKAVAAVANCLSRSVRL